MRIGLMAWGSDGDIRPMVALAAGLVRRGHEVRLVATSVDDTSYGPLCSRLNVPLELVPERLGATLGELALQARGSGVRLLERLLHVAYSSILDELIQASERLCVWSELVVGHFMAWPLRACATRIGRRHLSFVPWPGMVPSRARRGLL